MFFFLSFSVNLSVRISRSLSERKRKREYCSFQQQSRNRNFSLSFFPLFLSPSSSSSSLPLFLFDWSSYWLCRHERVTVVVLTPHFLYLSLFLSFSFSLFLSFSLCLSYLSVRILVYHSNQISLSLPNSFHFHRITFLGFGMRGRRKKEWKKEEEGEF